MPSTRISICLICACATGTTTIEPSRTSRAIRFVFIVPPSLKVQPKLLRDSKTDVSTDRHERCPRGMSNIPVHRQPNMHSGTHAHVGCDSGQENVATTPALSDSRDAVIRRMQPGKRWADKPLAVPVLRLIRAVRKPEARFEISAEARCLRPM